MEQKRLCEAIQNDGYAYAQLRVPCQEETAMNPVACFTIGSGGKHYVPPVYSCPAAYYYYAMPSQKRINYTILADSEICRLEAEKPELRALATYLGCIFAADNSGVFIATALVLQKHILPSLSFDIAATLTALAHVRLLCLYSADDTQYGYVCNHKTIFSVSGKAYTLQSTLPQPPSDILSNSIGELHLKNGELHPVNFTGELHLKNGEVHPTSTPPHSINIIYNSNIESVYNAHTREEVSEPLANPVSQTLPSPSESVPRSAIMRHVETPTLDDVLAYAQLRNYPADSARSYFLHFAGLEPPWRTKDGRAFQWRFRLDKWILDDKAKNSSTNAYNNARNRTESTIGRTSNWSDVATGFSDESVV